MYDLVLKGGTVIEGTRKPPRQADVCIADGKIAAIVDQFAGEAKEVVDVGGKTVAPGFIDIHTHSDVSPLVPPPFNAESKLYQGVTTEITGNCGCSIVPNTKERRQEINYYFERMLELPAGIELDMDSIDDYAERVAEKGSALNMGVLIGHGTLRGCVMGFGDREPSPEEMEGLKALLDQELSRGAFGMSLGLIYPPSAFSKQEELVELAKVLARHDALLAVHMRNEGPKVFEAVDEMLEIARLSGVHLQISHLKLMGKPQWHRAEELLAKINQARERGINVTCDQYPYNATSTGLSALVPKWAHDGGFAKMVERLASKDKGLLEDISREMDNRGGPQTVLVVSSHGRMPEIEGKTMDQVAKMLNLPAEEAVAEVLVRCEGGAAAIYFSLNEEDVITIFHDMNIAIASDGYSLSFDRSITSTNPHPRNFGTFPRFLQMNREKQIMPLEDAVYKITALPAAILGLADRGVLKEGTPADITVFDAAKIEDRSQFTDSLAKPAGIEHVIVGGVFALRDGRQTAARNGRVLRKTAKV